MRIYRIIALFSFLISESSYADEEKKISLQSEETYIVSIDADAVDKIHEKFAKGISVLKKIDDVVLLELSKDGVLILSQLMHEEFHRCGGYFIEDKSMKGIVSELETYHPVSFHRSGLRQGDLVYKAIARVSEQEILSTIQHLSSYRNRLYKSPTGVESQRWVGRTWKSLTKNLEGVSLEYFEHSNYPQNSVILTIKGKKHPEDIVVIGGHGDSIAGWNPTNHVAAPGADDNASGIASITETIRVLSLLGELPDNTVKFMSYAAEEVGLRGSKDIAYNFRQNNKNVLGVLQLDMTNYTTRPNEIVIVTDYTNASQNNFLKSLMRSYLPQLIIREERCGYACSDHASWTRYGYPSSLPFETRMNEYNKDIHTSRDTLERSSNRAAHAVNYSQIALAYLVEMAFE